MAGFNPAIQLFSSCLLKVMCAGGAPTHLGPEDDRFLETHQPGFG